MEKVNYYISTYTNSLLEDISSSIKPLDGKTTQYIMENHKYFNHAFKFVEEGRLEFKIKITEVRLFVFNKEELIQWIEKFKQDCEGETNKLYSRLLSTVGYGEKTILQYLENTGRLIGLFMEAERIEKMINAINPINFRKPHYQILDQLEAFDKILIEKNDIPGYYSIPNHELEKKQEYQLRNLNKDWLELLEWGKKNSGRIVKEEFGNIEYHFNSYHGEFKLNIINTRPRNKIKNFIDFHYDRFKYDKNIFIDHINCRIKESLKDFASSNHMIYEKIIDDWVASKRDLIADEQENYLIGKVYSSCEKFLDDIIENTKRNDENKFNIVIKNFLNAGIEDKGWTAYDQSMGGKTLTYSDTPREAFRDIIIQNSFGNRISAMECLRIKSVPKDNSNPNENIRIHVNKIFHNEPIGVSPLFIIVYCESKNFKASWEKYSEYIDKVDFPDYNKIEKSENTVNNIKSSNLKVLTTKHTREMNTITMHHFFINMNT